MPCNCLNVYTSETIYSQLLFYCSQELAISVLFTVSRCFIAMYELAISVIFSYLPLQMQFMLNLLFV